MATDPVTLVRINGAVQVAGGSLLALGKAPRLASLALAATLIPTTVTEHDFWNETDPAVKARKRTEFLKNLSLLGGVMIAAVYTGGKPSPARQRHALPRVLEHGAGPPGAQEAQAQAGAAGAQP